MEFEPNDQPSALAEPSPLPFPIAQGKLDNFTYDATTGVLRELQDANDSPTLSNRAVTVIAATSLGLCFPTDAAADVRMTARMELVRKTKMAALTPYVRQAILEVETAIKVAEKAKTNLFVMRSLGIAIDGSWGNLPAGDLAVKINKACYARFSSVAIR